MTWSKISYRQDLPPPGGYKPIEWTRIPAKTYFKGWKLIAGWLVVHFTGLYIWAGSSAQYDRWEVERRAGDYAVQAMLQAEKDRAYLKALRNNRDEEERLMKDVPGWEVGTYYGDKIYWTRPANEWHDITTNEYFAHARHFDMMKHVNFWKWL